MIAVRRAAEHALGLEADALDPLGFAIDRDDGGLVEDDAFALHVDERVGGAEVDGDRVRGEEPPRLEEWPAHLWSRRRARRVGIRGTNGGERGVS